MISPGVTNGKASWRRLWAALAVLAALVIAWGSLTPGSELPASLPWDKASHFIGYGGLAGLIGLAGGRLPLALLISVLYGAAIEVAQILVPGRVGGDPHDLFANALGAASAVAGLWLLRMLRARRRRRAVQD